MVLGLENHGDDRMREGNGRQTFSTINHTISRSRIFVSTSRDTGDLSTYHEKGFCFPAAEYPEKITLLGDHFAQLRALF